MTQTEEGEAASSPTAVERAERLASQAGERLGRLVGQTAWRVQHTRRKEPGQRSTPASQPEAGPGEQPAQSPTTERAEEMVGRFEQRVAHWTTVRNQQAKRAVARLREDAEDLWAEAQGVRGGWKRKRV